MIKEVNGRYVNYYAETNKPFKVERVEVYKGKNDIEYPSVVLLQDEIEFKVSCEKSEYDVLSGIVGSEVYVNFLYNPFGKYSFQIFKLHSFETIKKK